MTAQSDLDLDLAYDEGYFDKDAQGWCARNVQVVRTTDRVTIRRWGDDNGTQSYDQTETGSVGPVFPDLGLVKIVDGARTIGYVDLTSRRLRAATEYVSSWFVPAFADRDEGTLARIARHAAAIARALGLEAHAPLQPIVLPAATPSPTCEGALDRSTEIADGAARWTFLIRDAPRCERTLIVTVTGNSLHVGFHVESSTRAGIGFGCPVERLALGAAERDRQLAALAG
jgi:hypothetical protein